MLCTSHGRYLFVCLQNSVQDLFEIISGVGHERLFAVLLVRDLGLVGLICHDLCVNRGSTPIGIVCHL